MLLSGVTIELPYSFDEKNREMSKRKDLILKHPDRLKKFDQMGYQELVKEADRDEESLIRRATSTGRPLGTEESVRMLEQTLQRGLMPRPPR